MHRGHIQKDIHTNIHPPWQIQSSLPHTIHLCPAVPTTTPIPLGKCVHIWDCKYVCVGVHALLPTSTIHKFTPPQLLHPSLHPLPLHHCRPAVTTHKMQIESIFFLNSWWIKKNLQSITILFFLKEADPHSCLTYEMQIVCSEKALCSFAVFNRIAIVAVLILVPHYLGPWTNYLKSSRDVDECGSKGGECWVGLDVGI